MSNPRRRARRNPRGGTAPNGWRYTLKDNREWNEFQILARSPQGNLSEGKKQFYPYSSYDRVSKREARAEAEKALAQMIATGTLINPPSIARYLDPSQPNGVCIGFEIFAAKWPKHQRRAALTALKPAVTKKQMARVRQN